MTIDEFKVSSNLTGATNFIKFWECANAMRHLLGKPPLVYQKAYKAFISALEIINED
jgi:hypothetical protein